MFLHLSNFCLGWSSVTDFSNTAARANLVETGTFFIRLKGNAVWTYSLN